MKPRRIISKHALLHWIELGLVLGFFCGALILINVIAGKHNRRFDLTPGKRYTLSPQTIQVLNTLDASLSITVFYKKDEKRTLEDTLELFARACPRLQYSFLELDKNPARAEGLGIRDYGAGVLEYKNKKEPIRFLSEESLVTAILRLTEQKAKIVRFVTGHGEKSLTGQDAKTSYSSVKNALELENYQLQELLLLQSDKVPEDTRILVIGGPEKDFLQKEIVMVDAYLKSGGRVLVLLDPSPLTRLENYLKTLSVELAHDFIIDKQSKLIDLDETTPVVFPEKNHPIASRMNDAVVFPLCRSIIPAAPPRDDLEIRVLAQSGPQSWAERNKESVYSGTTQFDKETDIRGPVPVALTLETTAGSAPGTEKTSGGKHATGRVVVMGDADFITNHYQAVLGNKDFFLNSIDWLAERTELMAARPKSESTTVSMLFLTETENKLILWSAVIIEPALVLLLGIGVAFWRRLRR